MMKRQTDMLARRDFSNGKQTGLYKNTTINEESNNSNAALSSRVGSRAIHKLGTNSLHLFVTRTVWQL